MMTSTTPHNDVPPPPPLGPASKLNSNNAANNSRSSTTSKNIDLDKLLDDIDHKEHTADTSNSNPNIQDASAGVTSISQMHRSQMLKNETSPQLPLATDNSNQNNQVSAKNTVSNRAHSKTQTRTHKKQHIQQTNSLHSMPSSKIANGNISTSPAIVRRAISVPHNRSLQQSQQQQFQQRTQSPPKRVLFAAQEPFQPNPSNRQPPTLESRLSHTKHQQQQQNQKQKQNETGNAQKGTMQLHQNIEQKNVNNNNNNLLASIPIAHDYSNSATSGQTSPLSIPSTMPSNYPCEQQLQYHQSHHSKQLSIQTVVIHNADASSGSSSSSSASTGISSNLLPAPPATGPIPSVANAAAGAAGAPSPTAVNVAAPVNQLQITRMQHEQQQQANTLQKSQQQQQQQLVQQPPQQMMQPMQSIQVQTQFQAPTQQTIQQTEHKPLIQRIQSPQMQQISPNQYNSPQQNIQMQAVQQQQQLPQQQQNVAQAGLQQIPNLGSFDHIRQASFGSQNVANVNSNIMKRSNNRNVSNQSSGSISKWSVATPYVYQPHSSNVLYFCLICFLILSMLCGLAGVVCTHYGLIEATDNDADIYIDFGWFGFQNSKNDFTGYNDSYQNDLANAGRIFCGGAGLSMIVSLICLIVTCCRVQLHPKRAPVQDVAQIERKHGYSQLCTALMSVLLVLCLILLIGSIGYYYFRFLEYFDDYFDYSGCDCEWMPDWGSFIQVGNIIFLYVNCVMMIISTPAKELPNMTVYHYDPNLGIPGYGNSAFLQAREYTTNRGSLEPANAINNNMGSVAVANSKVQAQYLHQQPQQHGVQRYVKNGPKEGKMTEGNGLENIQEQQPLMQRRNQNAPQMQPVRRVSDTV